MPSGLLSDIGMRRLVRIVIAQTLIGFQEKDDVLRAEFRRLDNDAFRDSGEA